MNFEFMTIDTPLPPCMPFPRALTGFPVSSTAKVMYCRMLDAMLSKGQEDENGILFVCFPVTAIAAVLSRSPMTVKDSTQNELQEEQEKLLSEIAELKTPLTEVQADLKKLRDIRYWVRKATPGTEESKEPPKKQPIKEVLQDKADEKKAQRTVPAQTKHKQQDMEL